MNIYFKRWTSIIIFCIILSSFPIISQASYAAKYAFRDEAGNIILQTRDHNRTSDICYRTIGWTLTRCVLGTKEPIEEQYITIPYTGEFVNDTGDGYTDSSFIVSEADFLAKIASVSGEWLADIQSGKTCYIRFDAIMVTRDWSKPIEEMDSGLLLSENNQDYMLNLLNDIPGVYDKYNYEDLMYNTYSWYSPESIRTHYDIYLLYNGGEEKEPVSSEELVDKIGKEKPEYYTWNTSDEFDLSEGIPSGENITNGYGADKWYGNVTIGKHEEERYYNLSYNLQYHVYTPTFLQDSDGSYVLDDDGNKIQTGTQDNLMNLPVSFNDIPRKAAYYYAMDINVYELSRITVGNSVYPGDENAWNYSGTDVPMKVILDGEVNPTAVADWMSESEKHIEFPEPYNETIIIDCGEGIGSAIAMKQHLNEVIYDDEITDEDYIKGVISWNDLVEINGVKYLDDEKVEHANDTSKVIIEYLPMTNGKDDALYLFQEDEVTVKIPNDVANGAYHTAMEAVYNKRILNDQTVVAWAAADRVIAPFQDLITEHIKPGYEKNEPVYVHTPVIAPVSIIDPEDKTQLITENRTDYTGWVDKDGRYPDGKAIYELILDNEYTFKFDPANHRDIQGYGWSGDPSKYDEYVKGKYVAFPFAAQVKVNGVWSEFYEADYETVDDEGNEKLAGYTKWIEVENNETTFYIPPWAQEGTLWEIKYRVEAYNVLDENGEDHRDDEEGSANITLNDEHEGINYVATYVLPVELSGVIYDFEIIGTNYYDDYNYELESGTLPFAPRKWEKKQGNRNRLGGTSVRYTLDGTLTTALPATNVLPMSMGTSGVWQDKGYLLSGDTITFSVKTIANLWDEGIDSIQITPTFRWYEPDGTVHDDLQIYYWDDDNKNQMIRYGSELDIKEMITEEDDAPNNQFRFWDIAVAGSVWDTEYTMDRDATNILSTDEEDYQGDYHDEDLLYTVDWHNRHYQDPWELRTFLGQPSYSYCLSAIKLNSRMRTLTGNYEQLARNANKERADLEIFNLDTETNDRMKYSMQTWYGQYTIPTNMLICDADTFENLGATDVNADGEVDYWDYLVCKDEVVDKYADFWLNNKGIPYGYLMLNFDIMTVNNEQPHLTYHGGSNDMWQKQGAKQSVKIGSPLVEDTSKGQYPVVEIPTISGDVAIINPDESIYDGYKAGTFMIN